MAKLLLLFATVLFCAAFGNAQAPDDKEKEEKYDSCADVDVDYSGFDIILRPNVPTWRHCARSCKASPDCKVFTYVFDTKCCYHKEAGAAANKESGTGKISASEDCGLYPTEIMDTCEGDDITLECPVGQRIKISAANFGRLTLDVCPPQKAADLKSTTCEDPTSVAKIRQSCQMKQSCTTLASTLVFGDPCRGTSKYLTVSFYCVPEPVTINVSPNYPTKAIDGGMCYFPKQYHLDKSNLVGTIPKLGKSYEISFSVWPISFPKGWSNLIHFTTGGNIGAYGSRTPAVFFNSDLGGDTSPAKMYTASAISGNDNDFYEIPKPTLKKWMSMKIIQQVEDGKYYFFVFTNDKLFKKVENSQPVEFKDLQLYVGDPWYTPTDAWIKNLCISTKYL